LDVDAESALAALQRVSVLEGEADVMAAFASPIATFIT